MMPLFLGPVSRLCLGCLVFVGVSWVGGMLGVAQDQDAAQPPAETLEFRRIRADDYANFPVNWSSERPYRVGLIRSLEDYEKVFNAAAVGGNRRPYGPEAELFEQEMLIVVGRVIPAPANLDRAMVIERVVAKGQTLEVTFRSVPGPDTATYTVKAMATVRVPRRDVERVVFWEGDKKVEELDVATGQWLLPAVATAADNTTDDGAGGERSSD